MLHVFGQHPKLYVSKLHKLFVYLNASQIYLFIIIFYDEEFTKAGPFWTHQ